MTSKLSQVNRDLHEMKRFSQLLDYIPDKPLAWGAFFLLFLWVVFPAAMWLIGFGWLPVDEPVRIVRQTILYNVWSTLLMQIGYLGNFLAIIIIGKSILRAKREKTPFKVYFFEHGLTIFLGLMILWSVVSTLLSDSLGTSLYGHIYRREGLLTYFAYAGVLTCGMLIRDARRVRQLLKIFVLASLVTSIPYILNWIPGITWSELLHDPSVFHNANHHGYYLVMVTMVSLALFLTEKRRQASQWIWAFSYAVSVAALNFNSSLGPYLAVVGGFILYAVFLALKNWRAYRWQILLAAIILIGLSLLINLAIGQLGNDLLQLFKDSAAIVKGSEGSGLAGSGRWELWQHGVRFAIAKPWFGYGPDNLHELYLAVNIIYDRPHNELIQFAASLGFPALLFYISAMVMHLRGFLMARKQASALLTGVFATVGAYLISSIFGNSMYYTTPFFLMILGMSYGMLKKVNSEF